MKLYILHAGNTILALFLKKLPPFFISLAIMEELPTIDPAILIALGLDAQALNAVTDHIPSAIEDSFSYTLNPLGEDQAERFHVVIRFRENSTKLIAGMCRFYLTRQNHLFVYLVINVSILISYPGEVASSTAMQEAAPGFCPKVIAHGALKESSGFFIVTEFIERDHTANGHPRRSPGSSLAILHSAQAPVLQEYETTMFGFPMTTFCNGVAQNNS